MKKCKIEKRKTKRAVKLLSDDARQSLMQAVSDKDMRAGMVTFWSAARAFGFVEDAGQKVFFHKSEVVGGFEPAISEAA